MDEQLREEVCVCGTCERLRKELVLARERERESEERFRTVLGQSIDGVYRRNLITDCYDYLSPAFERITGFTVEEFGRLSRAELALLVHPDDRPVIERRVRELEHSREGGDVSSFFEYRLMRKDGVYRWLSDSGVMVFGPDGEPLYYVGVARDITESKEAEAERLVSFRQAEEAMTRLRESEERLRFLGDNLPGVLLYQLDCGADGLARRFTYVSRGVEQIHGMSVAEAMESPFAIYSQLHEEDSRSFAEMERSAMEDMSMFRAETRIILPSGETKWILIASAPRRAPDGHVIWNGFEIDLTFRKQLEDELRRHSQELEKAVADRTARLRRLASELALAEQRERRRLSDFLHDDLQQVLVAAMYGAEGVVADMPEGAGGERARKLLGYVMEAVGKVRAFSGGLTTPLLYVVGLVPALKELAEQMQARYGLRVDFEVGDLPDIADEAVRSQLFLSVRELLFNAAKHSGADAARLQGCYFEGRIELTVSDEGKGFDPGAVLGCGSAGCGYGLFSVGERVGDLGGIMRVESSPGGGTRVAVAMPVQDGPATEQRAVRRAVPQGRGDGDDGQNRARVLVADDHDLVREGVVNVLSVDRHLEVVGEAKNGREAVELARKLRPDVIVMDIKMPEMDGIEATRLILSELPGVIVVGISAFGDQGFRSAMLEAGAADLLDKADAGERLTVRIAECLAGRRKEAGAC